MEKNELKLYQVSEQKKKTIYDYVDEYVSRKYDIRFNEISQEFQISIKGLQIWEDFEVNSLLIELAKSNIEINPGKLDIYLRSNLIPRFNPITEYFNKLPKWIGGDHIRKLASYLPTRESEEFLYHFRKWLVRSVKGALEDKYFNKQCLVLVHSEQNSGKSTWCRFLCPPALSRYFTEDLTTDKDARIQLTRNFIINLDELSVLAKREINALKAYFSKTMINERLPYDRKNSNLRRTCSFIGSTNRASFLTDETGSVRWLCFELLGKIDFNYSKEVDIDKVWAQAYYLAFVDPNFDPELTFQDIIKNEERNKRYREPTLEEELLAKFYDTSKDQDHFMTASDIITKLSCINPRLNVINMGRALKSRGYDRIKHSEKGVYGYLAKPLFKNNPWEIK